MTFPVCMYKSENVARGKQNFMRTHDRVSVTFRNTGRNMITYIYNIFAASKQERETTWLG